MTGNLTRAEKAVLSALVAALTLVACLFTVRASESPSPDASEEALSSATATRVGHPPKLDGSLNDPLWQLAQPITDFRQQEPHEGEPATEKTEVRILYTRTDVYFGIHCYQSDPSHIVASELRRDVSQALDDHFEILIDSTHARRGGYVFEVNPLGTQADGIIVDEQPGPDGDDFDRGWDGVWTSEARIGSDGWTATVEIPFTTLNFTHSTDVIWYVNFKRFIRSKNEDDLWRSYKRTYGLTKVSQAGRLTGISDVGSGRLLVIKPYALAQYDKTSGQNPLFPLTGGVDVKYGLTSNLLLNLTANTDFSDTEADLEPFNLTPFRVFIPEKRQFFLENAGIFNFQLGDQDQLFFSRQIGIDPVTGQEVPINGGAKLTGTVGNTDFGILDISTRSSGPNFGGNFLVARVKESLWPGSFVGIMGIDKESDDPNDSFNRSGGVDTRLVFFRDWIVDAHVAGTLSPGDPSGATDVGASLWYRSNWFEGFIERRKVGPNFNPEVGFLLKNNSNESLGDLLLKARPRLAGIRELQFEGFALYDPDTHNHVSTQQWVGIFRALFNNGAYSEDDIANLITQRIITPFHIYKNVYIRDGVYHFTRHQFSYSSGENQKLTYNAFERFGSYYSGTLNEVGMQLNYRPTPQFSISTGETWDRFRLPFLDGDFSVALADIQANYSFTRFLTFTSIVQMDTTNTQAVSANLRLRWNYRPDSDLYVIYNVGTQFASIAPANPPQVRETRLGVKFTYSFLP